MVYDAISLSKLDEVYMKLECENSTAQEISDYFTFEVPGHQFMPSFRARAWDGKIRLFSYHFRKLYIGLLPHLKEFARSKQYLLEYGSEFDPVPVTPEIVGGIVKRLQLPFPMRDYQYDAVHKALSRKRCMLISPTASGKSLIIYTLIRTYEGFSDKKILIVVPTTSLVEQMYKDFDEYAVNIDWDSDSYCHRIYSGKDKETDKPIIISTWQSIHRLGLAFFKQFGMIIGDEAHGFKSKSLTNIMTKLVECPYRIGTTGTLDGTKTHKLVLEGLFGQAYEVISTKDLMDKEYLAKLEIHCAVLQYTDEDKAIVKKLDYQKEIQWLVSHERRNNFIVELANRLEGNTLVLYFLVEKHGKILYDKLASINRNVNFIHGGTNTMTREKIREDVDSSTGNIIIASYGTYSTGINIKNLNNVIFASPSKSRIRKLQSIGRGLRTSENKDSAILYDISDDLCVGDHQNYTFRHFLERLKIYDGERFDYQIKKYS